MSTSFEELLDGITSNKPDLASADERAVELFVLLPLLRWAAWDTSKLRQVYPQMTLLDSRRVVDYCLQIDDKSRVFIEVKRWSHDLTPEDENQLEGYCVTGEREPDIAVLTNGQQWRLYLAPKTTRGKRSRLREFLVLDITDDKEALESRLRQFLAFDSIRDIRRAIASAEALWEEHTRNATVQADLREAWNFLAKDKQMQMKVLGRLAHDREIPANETQLEQFLDANDGLINEVNDPPPPRTRIMPRSFTLPAAGVTEPRAVRYWNELTAALCILMSQRHPDVFRSVVLGMPGNSFSESQEHGFPIGDTGIYCKWATSKSFRELYFRIVSSFNYPEGSLTIRENT